MHELFFPQLEQRWQKYEDHGQIMHEQEEKKKRLLQEEKERKLRRREKLFKILQQREEGEGNIHWIEPASYSC